jgi:TIR domain-containing protein
LCYPGNSGPPASNLFSRLHDRSLGDRCGDRSGRARLALVKSFGQGQGLRTAGGTAMAARIFINYRRDDSTGTAGRLHDRLAQSFGRKNLFMDVDHIPAGVDFVIHLSRQVAACDVFLALIGPSWLDARNEKGERRLHDPDDFVAIEIEAALARNIRLIPVLVGGARMPKASELPESLKPLVRRHAVELRHTQFGRDAEALIAEVGEAFAGGWLRPRPWRVAGLSGLAAAAALLVGAIGVHLSPDRSPLAHIVSPSHVANPAPAQARVIRSDPFGLGPQAGLPMNQAALSKNQAASIREPDPSLSPDARDGDFADISAAIKRQSELQREMSAELDRQNEAAKLAISKIKGY